jgi:hypothetical protein
MEKKESKSALEIYRKLLRCCPHDNLGVRDFILAIRLDWTYDKFHKKLLDKSGQFYNTDALMEFQERYDEFPDEFDWWKKEVGYDD